MLSTCDFYTHTLVFPSSGNILAHEKHLKGSFFPRAERIVLSPKLDYNTRKATELSACSHIRKESCYLLYSQEWKKETE